MGAWSQIWFALIKTNKQKKTKKKWYFPYIQIHSCKFTPATEVWEIYTTLFNKTEWKSYSFCFTTYTFPYSKAKCSSVTSSFVFAVFFSFFLLSDELNLSESHDMCISSLWHGFNWSIVVLYFVSFCCTAKWISYSYIYFPSFMDFLPIWVTTEHLVEFPELYSRFLLYFIHSIKSKSMSIPASQFILPPLILS